MNTEIYFNGQKAYFDKEENIVASYANNKVGDLKSRQGIASNTYKLPYVKQNKEIFADAELIANEGSGPYIKYDHEVFIEGISVFKGSAFVSESWGSYKVQAIAGNSDFYLSLRNNTLLDLDYSDLDHTRNDATIISSWVNTEGYIYPFIDYGKYQGLPNSSIGSDDSANIVCPDDLYPAIFRKTIIKKISEFTGYIFTGDVFSLPRFSDEIIPFTKFPFTPEGDQGKFSGITRMITVTPLSSIMINLITVEDPGNNYSVYGFYSNLYAQWVNITIDWTVNSGILNTGNVHLIGAIRAADNISNGPVDSTDRFFYFDYSSSKRTTEVFLNPGERIFVYAENEGSISTGYLTLNEFSIEVTEVDQGYGLPWKFSNNLPNISLDKFLLDFMNSYGLSIDTDNDLKVITFIFDDDILLNEQLDWSGRIDYSNKTETDLQDVTYRLENYTKNNLLNYKTSEWLPNGFDKIFTIDDEYLKNNIYTDFESEFSLAPLAGSFLGGVQTINVNMFTVKQPLVFRGYFNGTYSIDDVVFYKNKLFKAIGPTISTPELDSNWEVAKQADVWNIQSGIPLITRINRLPNGPSVDFQDAGLTEIKVFAINTDMDWPTIWDDHYQALQRMLVKTKILQLPLRLNYSDIANLDLIRPVWIKELGLRFKCDEVIQFKLNQVDSTLVRLIRL